MTASTPPVRVYDADRQPLAPATGRLSWRTIAHLPASEFLSIEAADPDAPGLWWMLEPGARLLDIPPERVWQAVYLLDCGGVVRLLGTDHRTVLNIRAGLLDGLDLLDMPEGGMGRA